MKAYGEPLDVLPTRWLAGMGLIFATFVAILTWLYFRTETVLPEQHFAYTQHLRDLRELDARINGELLANRLEQVRNYDALTDYMRRAQLTAAQVIDPPQFLADPDRKAISEVASALQKTLVHKAEMIDRFKRDNSVLRNSLAYFPVAVADFLDPQAHDRTPDAVRKTVEQYAREVLAYAHAVDEPGYRAIAASGVRLAALSPADDARGLVSNIMRHGEIVAQRLSALDSLMRGIVTLNSDEQLERLNHTYAEGHARALLNTERYRKALYSLSILLTTFIAWLFLRLDRTRRSLARAHREVSARYAAQLAAEEQLTLHATAFRNAHDGITLTDADGNILDVNPAFSRITGWERSEVIGRNPRVLKSGRHDREFYAAMWKSIQESGSWHGEIWNRNKYGEIYPELLSISAVRDKSAHLTNYVAVFSDIGRLKAQERQLTQLAYYDALTELPNRALLADRLLQGIAQTRRTNSLMAICYLDLDGFKPINDTWGHEAGDSVLIDIAHRLRGALRGGDTVARLGGDEFALLLLGLGSIGECDEAVRRLLKLVAQPLLLLPKPVSVSASIGVTLFPCDDEDPDTLLRHADQAMYHAKQEGKNCYHLFDAEQDRSTRSRHDRVARIRQALEEHEFVLFYQPKVNMRLGTVIGAEALIRWNHPERGMLLPVEFLPLIEDDDLVKLIGDWVIETALVQMEAWRAAGLELPVSVNVAGRQLQAPEFVEKLKVALFLHSVVAHQLELEILETAALEDVIKTSRVIDECRQMGVRFSLDDFGTGYSSLSYLKRLPAEAIKIDQSFVREILNDHNNLVIVQGVVGLAAAFQRQVIAEGVESPEHGRLLMQINCDLAQGYGIAKPMPASQVADWVKEWRPDSTWQAIARLHWDADDYPMLIAEIQLRNWVSQLIYTANEGQPPPHQRLEDVRHCLFGHWYCGPSRNRYINQPAFAKIEARHNRLHEVASRMDRLWRDGRLESSRALIPELLAARDETLDVLYELQLAMGLRRVEH